MIDERCQEHPRRLEALTLAGSLLSDWGDFEYYQQLAGDAQHGAAGQFPKKEQSGRNLFRPGRQGVCQVKSKS